MSVRRFPRGRRLILAQPATQRDLFTYLYAISSDRGSGEHALYHLLAPGAYARWPLLRRLPKLNVPVTFCYGSEDWMDPVRLLEPIGSC